MKKLGLATIALSVLLLSGCGEDSTSSAQTEGSSSTSADIVIYNISSYDIKYVWFKKTSDNDYDTNILTEVLKSGDEVAVTTSMCDIRVDGRAQTTSGRYSTIARNVILPCGETSYIEIKQR